MLSMSHNEGSRQLFCGINFLLHYFFTNFYHFFFFLAGCGRVSSFARTHDARITLLGVEARMRRVRTADEGMWRVWGRFESELKQKKSNYERLAISLFAKFQEFTGNGGA